MIPHAKILFLAGVAFDTLITPIGVLIHNGIETNPFINWIHPPGLMMAVFIGSNLIFVPMMIRMVDLIKENERLKEYPDIILWSIGTVRLACGMTWIFCW